LFLDIDGVLISGASMIYWHKEHSAGRSPVTVEVGRTQAFCPICTSNFEQLLADLPEDVKIVLSSTWRIGRDTLEDVQELFISRGIDASRVIGRTPTSGECDSGGIRGVEIQAWLDKHPEVTDLLILDDDSDMEHLKRKLLRTEFPVGLTLPIVEKIINRFKKSSRIRETP
jgi:hypothetical protein